jgi:hypothetical protein
MANTGGLVEHGISMSEYIKDVLKEAVKRESKSLMEPCLEQGVIKLKSGFQKRSDRQIEIIDKRIMKNISEGR